MILVLGTLGELTRGFLRLGPWDIACHWLVALSSDSAAAEYESDFAQEYRQTDATDLNRACNKPAVFRRQNAQQNERLRWLRDFGQSLKSRRPPTMPIGAFYS